MTFTPEFIREDRRDVILISNHDLSSPEAIRLSVAFNRARIAFGRRQLPKGAWTFWLFYDIRGQGISQAHRDEITQSISPDGVVEFMT